MAGEIVLLYDDQSPTKERDLILGIENIKQHEIRRVMRRFTERFTTVTASGKKEHDFKAYQTLELYGPGTPVDVLNSVIVEGGFTLESQVLRVEFGREIGEPGHKRVPSSAIDLIFLNSDEVVEQFFGIPLYGGIRNDKLTRPKEWHLPAMVIHAFSLPSWKEHATMFGRIVPVHFEKYAASLLGQDAFQESRKEQTYK